MHGLDHYHAMARYNHWMNGKLFALAAELSDADRRRDLGAFFGSIHGTFNHILLADRVWLGRFTGDPERHASRDAEGRLVEIRSLAQELYTDFDTLHVERERTDREILAFVAGLTEDRLVGTLRYTAGSGAQAHPLWWALSHFFNHQTHHRGQATTLFKQLGHDPGVTDLIAFLRTEAVTV